MIRSITVLATLLFSFSFLLGGCSAEEKMPFRLLSHSETNIDFSNDVISTPDFNIQNYLYFYDGGGVAAGDINNDGLPDLFFTGNMTDNRLYLNKGDLEFEDITESSGITDHPDSWSTGVTMADITGNGFLDIYVSRVNYHTKTGTNQLFINNGDQTFTEKATEYGVDFEGYSTQAAFFDYNNNGRLDLFLLNHTFHSSNTYGQAEVLRQRVDDKGGDRLFRNDGGKFTDVTEEAGIYSSALGYGLGLAISDINQDGFPDIYVGNDFHEDDYLYINNGDGTFTNSTYTYFSHTSNSSMGNDIADINNDGLPDLVSLDMMPEDHETFMITAGPDLVVIAEAKRNFGFGDKNNRNTLQINRGFDESGIPVFSETAFSSGIARTDWSWAALFADYNNDGFNDLFVTNGIPHRPNDLDYVARLRQTREQYSDEMLNQQEYELEALMPSKKISNYMFENNGRLMFEDSTTNWGLDNPAFSTGAIYVDLNNNGYLDLVVNNINDRAFIYENTMAKTDSLSYLKLSLNSNDENSTGIGAKVFIYDGDSIFYREQMPVRGFQSSVDHTIHFGLGHRVVVDSLTVIWPDGSFETQYNIPTNQTIQLLKTKASGSFNYNERTRVPSSVIFTNRSEILPEDMRHEENNFNDFNREPLMPFKSSTRGPALAVGDVTGNGLDDIYLGSGRNFPGKLYQQVSSGVFEETNRDLFSTDQGSEDTYALFFDATGDGALDLYVASGGNEHAGNSQELADRLYINQGDGVFQKSINSIPNILVNSSVVKAADFDGDGHTDLFVGGHSIPWRYGVGPQNRLLKNNGKGVFKDVMSEVAPGLEVIGNVTSAVWVEKENTAYPDLVVAGEWMPIQYFIFENGEYVSKTEEMGLAETHGLWQSLHVADITGNGKKDIIAGNFGKSSRLQPTQHTPIRMYLNDFNEDGQTLPLLTYMVDGKEYLFEPLDELLRQVPDLTQRVQNYADYSQQTVHDLVSSEKLDGSLQKKITTLASIVLLQETDETYNIKELPWDAQTFPVMAVYSDDFTNNGDIDILLTGNIFDVKPSMGGKQGASYGLMLTGSTDKHFESVALTNSGFLVRGEGRKIVPINIGEVSPSVLIGRNNDTPLLFSTE